MNSNVLRALPHLLFATLCAAFLFGAGCGSQTVTSLSSAGPGELDFLTDPGDDAYLLLTDDFARECAVNVDDDPYFDPERCARFCRRLVALMGSEGFHASLREIHVREFPTGSQPDWYLNATSSCWEL